MKALKYLSFVGKIAGLVSALNVTVNRIGDLLDDGKPNQSFKG